MPQMTPAAARVVDPILTTVARGYRQGEAVGLLLFPRVYVSLRGGRTLQFGREDFTVYNTARAPGTNTKRVQVGYLGEPYALEDHSLEGLLPDEISGEAAAQGIDVQSRALNAPLRALALELEVAQATLALNAAKYDSNHKVTLSGTDKWSNAASKPGAQMRSYREAVRQSIGVDPNTLVLAPDSFNDLAENPAVQDRFKYTSADSLTLAMAAAYFEVQRVVVGKAIRWNPATQAMENVWGSGSAVLAYVPANPQSYDEPSYGYTYTLAGMPLVRAGYRDEGAKSWAFPVDDVRAPAMTAMTAGFLIQGIH